MRPNGAKSAYIIYSITFGGGEGAPRKERSKMEKTTNVYILVDTSYSMKPFINRISEMLTKITRAARFSKNKIRLNIWGYNDRTYLLDCTKPIKASGNSNLKFCLEMLKSLILYNRKYTDKSTRSIFLLIPSSKVLYGWKEVLDSVFCTEEFTFGHRYAIVFGEQNTVCRCFTDSEEKILPYFSHKRLLALVNDIHRKGKKW